MEDKYLVVFMTVFTLASTFYSTFLFTFLTSHCYIPLESTRHILYICDGPRGNYC